MSDSKQVDQVAAEIVADQRNQALQEAARAKATIAINAEKAATDPAIVEEKKLRLFKCTMPNSQYVTRKGKYITFPDGIHTTQDAEDIAELEYEISKGHQYIYIDPTMKYVDTAMSPTALAERARLKEEVKQELMRDMGFTPQGGVLEGIKNSGHVAEMMQGNIGAGGVNAKLLATLNALPKATGK